MIMPVTKRLLATAATCAVLLLSGCSSPQPSKEAAEERKATPPPAEPAKTAEAKPPEPPKAPEPAAKTEEGKKAAKELPKDAPDNFRVKFTTSKGLFVVEVHKAWAPKGVQRFYELVKDHYYDGNRFFRIVPRFIVQFGMAGDPAMGRKWDKNFPDDPVTQTNRTGSVTFATAGPNTRTTQLFINLNSNQALDAQGFAPFGMVVEGMSVVEGLNAEYGERPDQGEIRARGNAYLTSQFPRLDYIKKAEIVPAG